MNPTIDDNFLTALVKNKKLQIRPDQKRLILLKLSINWKKREACHLSYKFTFFP